MSKIQEVFHNILEKKKQLKKLRAVYRDMLDDSSEYNTIKTKMTALRERKAAIETSVQNEMGSGYSKLENLKNDIQEDNEQLSDMAVSKVMGGESVSLTDAQEQEYEPVVSVKFKKVK